jgi:hypothetical protein
VWEDFRLAADPLAFPWPIPFLIRVSNPRPEAGRFCPVRWKLEMSR